MKSVNEKFAEMQKKTLASLEPMQNMNAVAAEAFERIARKNYDLMGDLVDYAVAQVKTPEKTANLQEAYEQRVADTKAFAEKVNARAAEYVALAGELGDMAKSKAPKAATKTAEPKTAAKPKAAEKTAEPEAAAEPKAAAKTAEPKVATKTAEPKAAAKTTAKATPAKTATAKTAASKTAAPKATAPKAATAKTADPAKTTSAAPAKAAAQAPAKATAAASKSTTAAAKPATRKKASAKKTAAKAK